MPSHYCRKNTERLYLEGPFKDIQDIYNVYKDKSNDGLIPFSKIFFRNYMKDKKLSIFSPRKDQCDLCCAYQFGNISENKYAFHIASKNRARQEKEFDKTKAKLNECYSFCMDLQAVQLCPVLDASSLYYNYIL